MLFKTKNKCLTVLAIKISICLAQILSGFYSNDGFIKYYFNHNCIDICLAIQDVLTCDMVGSPESLVYFDVDPAACLVRIKKALTDDTDRKIEYVVSTCLS